jgi:hypothetical protein
MTEEQNVSGAESSESNVSAQPAYNGEAAQAAPVEHQAEKMVPQSKVNEIVGATKKSAYDKAYQDASANILSENQSSGHESTGENQDIPALVQKEVENRLQRVKEDELKETQQKAVEEQLRNTAQSLQTKISDSSKKYEDFNDVTNIDFKPFQHLLVAADNVENSGDVLYHLCKNPSKFRDIARDLEPGSPYREMAMKDLQALSSSLKNNETAKQIDLPRSPLSTIKPSNVGSDNGKMTLTDMKRRYTV